MAIAYEVASCGATKSFRAIASRRARRGTLALPAYGSIEMRPMIHASALKVFAVRSYSAEPAAPRSQCVVTMRPSMEGSMWQMTCGRGMDGIIVREGVFPPFARSTDESTNR